MAGNEPERIEEQHAAAQIAGLRRDAGDDGAVTLSGRCGDCGYLLESPGHRTSCGR